MRKLALILGLGTFVAGAVAAGACTVTDGGSDNVMGDAQPGPSEGGPSSDAPAGDSGPRTDGVIREIAYHEVTGFATPAELPTAPPVISGDGKRIAFAVGPGTGSDATPNKIFVMDADGSNLKQVDAYKTGCFCGSDVAISDDGSTIVSTDGTQIRVVDAAGTLKGSLVGGEISDIALNGAGTEVFFISRRDSSIISSGLPLQRGTYKMSATATDVVTQILSPDNVVGLVGKTDPADIFPFNGCGNSLSVSADGSKVYTALNVSGVGNAIISGSGGGATVALAPITVGGGLVFGVAASRDGTKVGYWAASASPTGGEVVVMAAGGGGKKTLVEAGPGAGCKTPLSITNDGSKMALGFSALILPTDGSEPWTLIAGMGFFSNDKAFVGSPGGNSQDVRMAGDGKRFVYLNTDGIAGRQIAVAEVDPTDVRGAPKVTEPKITPASIPHDLGAGAHMEARVSSVPLRVGGQAFKAGLVDSNTVHADKVLLADGGVYSAEGVNASTNTIPGPRILRIKAEGTDAKGRRAAHAVDFGPLDVK